MVSAPPTVGVIMLLVVGAFGTWLLGVRHADARLRRADQHGRRARTPSGIEPYRWETKASWYDPATSRADFVITTPNSAPDLDVSESLLTTWFGRPAGIYHVPPYTITVWNKNLLPLTR
jgi:hypothetical protein